VPTGFELKIGAGAFATGDGRFEALGGGTTWVRGVARLGGDLGEGFDFGVGVGAVGAGTPRAAASVPTSRGVALAASAPVRVTDRL
jgi:hypothetical protein